MIQEHLPAGPEHRSTFIRHRTVPLRGRQPVTGLRIRAQALTIAHRCRGVCREPIGPRMSGPRSAGPQAERTGRNVTLTLEDFAWETLEEEAAREGVAVDELITFSVLYYLADVDSGRIARRIRRSPYPRRP